MLAGSLDSSARQDKFYSMYASCSVQCAVARVCQQSYVLLFLSMKQWLVFVLDSVIYFETYAKLWRVIDSDAQPVTRRLAVTELKSGAETVLFSETAENFNNMKNVRGLLHQFNNSVRHVALGFEMNWDKSEWKRSISSLSATLAAGSGACLMIRAVWPCFSASIFVLIGANTSVYAISKFPPPLLLPGFSFCHTILSSAVASLLVRIARPRIGR